MPGEKSRSSETKRTLSGSIRIGWQSDVGMYGDRGNNGSIPETSK